MDVDLVKAQRRLTRREYDGLVQLGAFGDERIELLYGLLIPMSPQNAPHMWAIQTLNMILAPALAGRAAVRVQGPLAVSAESEPEPDLAVVPLQDFSSEHPGTALLVIEVAGESLAKDRQIKGRMYAEAGVPEYWVVNLADRVIEVYTDPSATGYARTRRHAEGEVVRPSAFPAVAVPVTAVLPR